MNDNSLFIFGFGLAFMVNRASGACSEDDTMLNTLGVIGLMIIGGMVSLGLILQAAVNLGERIKEVREKSSRTK